jgi:hypothetical protein
MWGRTHLSGLGTACLLLALLPMLGGCLVVTTPILGGFEYESDSALSGAVGDEGSDKPVRPGATRESVHRRGGEPQEADASDTWEHYVIRETRGTAVTHYLLVPCHGGTSHQEPLSERARHVLLSYDDRGIVRSARVMEPAEFTGEVRRLRAEGTDLLPVRKPWETPAVEHLPAPLAPNR